MSNIDVHQGYLSKKDKMGLLVEVSFIISFGEKAIRSLSVSDYYFFQESIYLFYIVSHVNQES